MSPVLLLSLAGLFVSIALLTGVGASMVLVNTTTERRRLRQLAPEGARLVEQARLTEQLNPQLERIARAIPKSPKEMSRLRRRLPPPRPPHAGPAGRLSVGPDPPSLCL